MSFEYFSYFDDKRHLFILFIKLELYLTIGIDRTVCDVLFVRPFVKNAN